MVYECLRSMVTKLQGEGATAAQVIEYITENILGQIMELLPIILPVVIGFIAFRKGYTFLKGALRSA